MNIIEKIKIGSNVYNIKDANAIGSSEVTRMINNEIYGSNTKPNGASVVTSENIAEIAEGAGITGGSGDGDTKNTTGATNTSNKIYLIGATSQDTNPVTYSNNKCYIQDGYVYTNNSKAANSVDITNAINTELYGSNTKPSGAYAVTSQNITDAINGAGINTGGSGVSTYYQLSYPVTRISGSGAMTIPGTDPVYLINVTSNISSVTLQTNPPYGHSCHLIFKSDNNTQRTVVLSHNSTNRICPNGSDISLTVPSSGYVEIDLLNMGNSTTGDEIYVRGL